MNKPLIKSLKNLPTWFKLENYAKAKYFNAGEWYDELMPRFSMRKGMEKFINDTLDLPQRWQLIMKEGLLFYSAHRQNISHRVAVLHPQAPVLTGNNEGVQRLPHEFVSITSLANMYVYMSYWLLEIPEREKVVQRMRELFKDDGSNAPAQRVTGEAAEWIAKPFEDFQSDVVMGLKNKFAYARVKLDASDEQIKKDFALWLDYERKRRDCPAPKKNFSDVELSSWHESAVLPYLDLMFWSELENVKISQQVMTKAIFPDIYRLGLDIDPSGKLKTTKKKAEYLMNQKTMKLLELQIAE